MKEIESSTTNFIHTIKWRKHKKSFNLFLFISFFAPQLTQGLSYLTYKMRMDIGICFAQVADELFHQYVHEKKWDFQSKMDKLSFNLNLDPVFFEICNLLYSIQFLNLFSIHLFTVASTINNFLKKQSRLTFLSFVSTNYFI